MPGRLLAVLLGVVTTACTSVSVPVLPVDHSDFDRFLQRHVDPNGRVDYVAAQRDRDDLDRYLAAVAATSPDTHPGSFPSETDRLAFWIGAYNAWTIQMVLEAWPIESVVDVPNPLAWIDRRAGFFLLQRVVVGGRRMSLLKLENGIVRERFDEPRIHFALNCASISCPRLPAEAFVPQRLEEQLARETLRFLADERNVAVDLQARVVRLSSIFDWYEEDFTGWMARHRPGNPATLLGYVEEHAPEALARQLASCRDCEVAFATYDWGLNGRPTSFR